MRFLIYGGVLLGFALPLHAQTDPMAAPPSVFLDCERDCPSEHLRNEIRFVNWVRDRTAADVHALITGQQTGAGGQQVMLTLLGRQRFAGDSTTITWNTSATATQSERRDALTNRMAQGLLRYVVQTGASSRVRVAASGETPRAREEAVEVDDPWNAWVFSSRFGASLEGEQRGQQRNFDLSFSADRVTEDWKFEFDVSGDYREEEFKLSNRTVTSLRRDYQTSSSLVRAIAPRWSAGVQSSVGTSSFANQDLFARGAGVLEYSFFPYNDYTRRRLTLRYSVGVRHFDYEEVTIYDRLSEQRADQQLALSLGLQQPWGSASFNASGSHYFHDVSRYNLSTFANLNLRITRGLSLDVFGRYSRVRDQIYIAKGDASDEEVLLRRRALSTGYRYNTRIGLRYTFGSVFNNIVNPRIN